MFVCLFESSNYRKCIQRRENTGKGYEIIRKNRQEKGKGTMDNEQLEALFGPAALHSDHKRGEALRFYDSETQQERTGTILWVSAPEEIAGRKHPVCYVVDTPGFPSFVWPSDVIEGESSL